MTPEHVLLVEPSCGGLEPFSEMCCELSISAKGPGIIDENIICHLGHVDETVSLHVNAVVRNLELIVDVAELDFGMIRFGESATQCLTFHNPGRSPINWCVQLSPAITSDVTIEEFQFCPSSGTICPLTMCSIEVTFHPKRCQSLKSFLEVVTTDGDKTIISVTAEVQHPQVCLLESAIHIDAFVMSTTKLSAILFNQTALSTRFEWGEWCLREANVDVNIEPKSGIIEARQKVSIYVSITAHEVGSTGSLIVPCCIDGMDEPVSLSVTVDVHPLDVGTTLSISSDRESWLTGDGILIDFGGDNLLSEMPKRYLRIQNNSSIAIHFNLKMERFSTAVMPEEVKQGATSCKTGPATLIKKTANLADPSAKTGMKAMKELRAKALAGNSGIAFYLNPPLGELQPNSEEIVEITAFADLWGFYSDVLYCHISDLDSYNIPVMISVVDSPIMFQMVSHNPSLTPIMRFGTVVEGSRPITRRTRILNQSPADIRIDWQIFNIYADDQQLLDLLVVYGNPFPLKDKNGREIILQCGVGGNITKDNYRELKVDKEAVEELASKRPQLISLNMRAHVGTPATLPYFIEPPQLVRMSPLCCHYHQCFRPVQVLRE